MRIIFIERRRLMCAGKIRGAHRVQPMIGRLET
jgi:hypothetical protein